MKLSTGQPSTLGSYHDLCSLVFGKDSKATKYIETKIAESPRGPAEEVLADESQMVYVLTQMHVGEAS